MAKFKIHEPGKSREVTAKEFVKLPDGTMGEIISNNGYKGHIVINKLNCAVVPLNNISGWSNFEDTSFRIHILPAGTRVELTQEEVTLP